MTRRHQRHVRSCEMRRETEASSWSSEQRAVLHAGTCVRWMKGCNGAVGGGRREEKRNEVAGRDAGKGHGGMGLIKATGVISRVVVTASLEQGRDRAPGTRGRECASSRLPAISAGLSQPLPRSRDPPASQRDRP